MNYTPFYTKEFNKKLRKFRSLKRQINRKIQLLLSDPYHNCKSEQLLGRLKGLRSARLTENIRIISAICEEGEKYLDAAASEACRKLGDKTIVFITLDVHEKVYRRK